MAKNCNTCGKRKEDDEFNWRYKSLGIRHPTCRDCQKPYRKNWYEDNKGVHLANVKERKHNNRDIARDYVWDYLSTHACSSCGESDPTVLEFHHRHGKSKAVSELVAAGYSITAIQAEIDKCDVLCANCHRRVTSQNQGWFRK